ncbi:MAG: adenylate/guanylate cyclase domain-containing protein [Burkholderiales bacterium]
MTRDTVPRAVMFADVSGSTRLFNVLGDQRARDVIEAFVGRCALVAARHQGVLVKSVGDAALLVYESADAAVLAASALQAEVAASPLGGQTLRMHIGLNFGPVMTEHRDIFGDTVNVAAYITDMASPEQILTTEDTYALLSPPLKACTRPLFRARVKGTAREAAVFEVLWKTDEAHITELNPATQRLLPSDQGALLLEWGEQTVRVDHRRQSILIGRSPHCDIIVTSRFTSREHASIRTEGTAFYLADRSINGTFVEFDDGRSTHVLRRELPLDGAGRIHPGGPPDSDAGAAGDVIRFTRDRRSLYRV